MRLLILCFGFISTIVASSHSASLDIYMPERCKTEGRITLIQPDNNNNQIIKHHLPFTETIDVKGQRSTISIGYVAYPPVKYFSRKNSPLLTVDSNGKCQSQDDQFVSTISWFIKEMFPAELLANNFGVKNQTASLVGPTSLIYLIQVLTDGMKVTQKRETIHRNIPCTVFEYQKVIADDVTLVAEYFVPTDVLFNTVRTTFFSAKASTYNTAEAGKLSTANMLRATYIIDYYFIDDATKDSEKFDLQMRKDFNVPLAAGCSKYLKDLQPDVPRQTFSMSYKQISSISTHMIAYDHSSGLLRKERIAESVSIWDLKEDLLYHIDVDLVRTFNSLVSEQTHADVKACSVMKVIDDKLGPAFRPYKQIGQSIDLLEFIGAKSVSYMGFGTVRDLPCSIYETILDEPPTIFALTNEQLQLKSSGARQYIVQFYLLELDQKLSETNRDKQTNSSLDEKSLPRTGFWPAQINLYRQFTDTGNVELVDQLEVYDFFWSLDGWTKKNNELFMAGQCFVEANKQVRLEMALTFDKIHSSSTATNRTSSKIDENLRSLLPYNKFKLEYDLVDDVFSNVFEVSKMHLVDYELKLRPSHLDMRMLIADRTEDMELVYFGDGELEDNAYEKNQIALTAQTEDSCILMSSLINEISMVVYCPYHQSHDLSCTAVYNEPEPVFRNQINTDPMVPTCHVYLFKPAPLPKQALGNVLSKKQLLYKRPFNFKARLSQGLEYEEKFVELNGQMEDFELTHKIQLITVDHHAFFMPPPPPSTEEGKETETENQSDDDRKKQQVKLVRSFDSIDYKTPNDCERICNLDTNCRSYSYCKNNKQCILSSLDIRSSDLPAQLIRSSPMVIDTGDKSSKIVLVNDTTHDAGDSNYKLIEQDDCFIYERNYLSYYKQTDEVISLNRELAKQFPSAESTFYCAKMSIDIEASHSEHHIAMFAYCESTNVCILDENLFRPTVDTTRLNDTNAIASGRVQQQQSVDEMACRIYRKRYQTYFSISSRVFKPSISEGKKEDGDDEEEKLDLILNTVEECARACWINFGNICASFDFCTPGSCKINKLSANDLTLEEANDKLAMRGGCLHYERDLELDKLRAEHLIGRHKILDRSSSGSMSDGKVTRSRFMMNLLTYVLAFGAFIYGLALGRKVNDNMEAVTISRQTISANTAANQQTGGFDYQSFPLDDEGVSSNGSNLAGGHHRTSGGSDMIKMSVINENQNSTNSHSEQPQ